MDLQTILGLWKKYPMGLLEQLRGTQITRYVDENIALGVGIFEGLLVHATMEIAPIHHTVLVS